MNDHCQAQIHIKTISFQGHVDTYLAPAEAVIHLQDLGGNQRKWIYVDGVGINDMEEIDEEMLVMAFDITVTNQLGGG